MGDSKTIGDRVRGAARGLWRFLVAAVVFLVGRWEPPAWLRAILSALARGCASALTWARAHKAGAAALVVLLALAGGGGAWGWFWYAHRPRPTEFTVSVAAPGITSPEPGSTPDPLVFYFNGSVAPLKSIGKAIAVGPSLSPKIEGTWRWASDSRLSFSPKEDWPIGASFTVKLPKKKLVRENVLLSTYELEFATRPFSASIGGAEFYQDPVDASQKKVVATVTFSHPVDPQSFEKRVSMQMDARLRTEPSTDWKFRVTYDKYRVNAYLHSEPIEIPQKDLTFNVRVAAGAVAARGGPGATDAITTSVTVPGLHNFLRVEGATLSLVDNARFEPEQVLVLQTSIGVQEKELQSHLGAYLLPLYDPQSPDEQRGKHAHRWRAADQISPEILAASSPVALEAMATEKDYDTQHSYKYKAEPGRYLYLVVKAGVRGFGGYVLGDPFQTIERVGEFPSVLHILQSGAIVSLGGSKKVSLYARDVSAVRYQVGRVLPDQLHHLVTQSRGGFANPDFIRAWEFNADNLTDRSEEIVELGAVVHGKPQYLGFDLGKYLGSDGRRGLFLLRAESWNSASKSAHGEADQRLILVTDLGMIVKDAADGTHDVFVQSIHGGEPVAGAAIKVIGKNGVAVIEAVTDGQGHAAVGSLRDFKREKEPVLYLAQKGGDSSFLPLDRSDRFLSLSRFDVGGVQEEGNAGGLTAFLFSDRGIYRPGDEIRVAAIVRSRDFKQSLAGVPLELEVTNPRGLTVRKETLKLDGNGFVELRHSPPDTAPTGGYTFTLRLVEDGVARAELGSTTVRVREFLPDRMKITAHLSAERADGWVDPKDLVGKVTLANLYGTPAAHHKVRATISLTPGLPSFSKLRDYRFFDPRAAKEPAEETLADLETDDEGRAEFPLELQRFAAATYRLRFTAQGFEAEGGRSVAAESSVMVSPMPYLVGYKPDGDLDYLGRGAHRSVELLAVSPEGQPVAVDNLKLVVLSRQYVSVLMRQDNGTYKYQSVPKEVELSSHALALAAAGHKVSLSTAKPGDYAIVVRSASDLDLQRVEYRVAGNADVSRSMEKNAELQLALKSKDVSPGGTLELSIKAPYAGAGLITVERDRVYAHKWFKSADTASTQTIQVPATLEGGGYVSVSFLRDLNSPEVYTSPLSYAVAPFSVSRAERSIKITLDAAESARPGDDYKIAYAADRASKIIVYAVDEGILRVAQYQTPDPLAFFFQKRALEVRTAQILDLVLPEFERLLAASAPGGGDDAERALGANLNPFKRRVAKPVAFWSGIVDAGPDKRELHFPLPDSFNGTLRLMAVAVSKEAIGASDGHALVRGDFVIAPNVPTFVAPGDEFEVSVSVANNVPGSGKEAKIDLALATSSHLSVVGPASVSLAAAELHESTTSFRVHANDQLGSASLHFTASLGDKRARLSQDLSLRPAAPYATVFSAGHLRDGEVDVPVSRNLYPELRELRAGVSHLPLGVAHGLAGYLEKFPHGCTEQLVSQAVPAVVLGDKPDFGYSAETARATVEKTIALLRSRQNDDGGFGLWAANPQTARFPTVYALHVLTDARERGYAVPPDVMKAGLGWLATLAADDGDDLTEDRLRAYAIYVLARNGTVVTALASSVQKKLAANYPKVWQQDLAAAWLAATWKLLKENRVAGELIAEQRFGAATGWGEYYDGLVHDGALLYLLGRHFPDRARAVTTAELNQLVAPIYRGSYNTLSSAFVILGLESYGRAAAESPSGGMSLSELLDGAAPRALPLPAGLLPRVSYTGDARAIHVAASGGFDTYWMVSEAGFARTQPTQEMKRKIEAYREYTTDDGKPVKTVHLGDEIEAHIKLRSLEPGALSDIAVVDLLPGGFEVVMQEATPSSEAEANNANEGRADDGSGERGGDDRANAGDENGEEGGEAENGGRAERGDHEEHSDHDDHDNPGTPFALPISVAGTTFSPEYGDVREDRVVLYGSAGTSVEEFVYRIKATNVGTYQTAPVLADSMYDRSVLARGMGGKIVVEKAR